ncbi:MAG: hypothetical protein M1823_002765 [Watsoniomyces obsoletus]|nr:MAG: hypothetical protein M1823_002765 [Watsoniomyces obsoletus]
MSTERPSSTGFHNIRALFEKTESSTSPSRPHRLSSGALSNGSRSTSRSAVRSSFVAVEPVKNRSPQREEDQSNDMEESTAHRRRGSFCVDQASNPEAMAELKKTISGEIEQRRRNSLMETVPEVAVLTPAIGREGVQLGDDAMRQQEANGSTGKPDQGQDSTLQLSTEKDWSTQLSIVPASPSASGSPNANSPTTGNHEAAHDGNNDGGAEKTTGQPQSNGTKGTPGPSSSKDTKGGAEKKSATTGRETSKARDAKPAAKISAQAGPVSKKDTGHLKPNAKTTSGSGHQDGPTRPGAARASSASMAGASKNSPERNTTGLTRARSQIQKSAQAPKSSSEAPPGRGKSATRASSQGPTPSAPARAPAKVPTKVPAKTSNGPAAAGPTQDAAGTNKTSSSAETAPKARGSAFAPTASSAARTTGGVPPQSRNVSGDGTRDKPLQRQPSTRSGGKPATSSHPRPPGRHQPAADRKGPPQEIKHSKPPTKPANDDFLARMMRPTTSSAQKTHEKPATVSSKPAPTRNRLSVGRTKSGPPHEIPSAPASRKAHSDAGGQEDGPAQDDHSQEGNHSATDEPSGEASLSKSNETAVDEPTAASAPESTTENEQEDSTEQPTEEVAGEASTST